MMLEHVAVWTHKLEEMKDFYVKYFKAVPNEKFTEQNAESVENYFLAFGSTARLELLQKASVPQSNDQRGSETVGITHFAFAVGSPEELDSLTQRLKDDGYPVVEGPLWAADGFYESCVLDPDGNRVEIVVVPKA